MEKTVSSRISRGHALVKVMWIAVLLLLTVNAASSATTIWDESVSPLPFTWNHTNFDGFNVSGTGTEELIILQTNLKADQRTIDKNNLIYTTTAQPVPLKVVTALNLTPFMMINKGLEQVGSGKAFENGQYYILNWQAEKYVALNGKVDKLAKLAIEQEISDTKTLVIGETWNVGGGWALKVNSIDAIASPMQVWLTLSKDGVKKDDKVVSEGTPDAKPIYTYVEKSIAGENDVPVFVTYVDNVSATTGIVQFKYTWAIDEAVTQIWNYETYGVFDNAEVSWRNLSLRNANIPITLSPDATIYLTDNIMFKVDKNTTSLKFYPVVEVPPPAPTPTPTPTPSNISYEIRGTVWNDTSITTTTNGWNPANFPGFFYDIKDNLGTEKLIISQTDLSSLQRIIAKGNLNYTTTAQLRGLKVASELNLSGNNIGLTEKGLEQAAAGMAFDNGLYYIVGWQGEKYVALNGKVDKLSKLVVEQGNSDTDNITLAVGETWDIGDGWTLTANSIDASATPKQVWFTLSKDGIKKDDKVVTSGTPNSKPIYTYVEKSINGETDVPLFVTYVDSIYSGDTNDMVRLRYTWAISTSVTSVTSGNRYGNFKVAGVAGKTLSLRNSDTSIILSRDSKINLIGNISFRVADSEVLRFYPVMNRTVPGTYEIRGTLWDESVSPAIYWNPRSFAGFFYDLNEDLGAENLSIIQPDLGGSQRIISNGNLIYSTTAQPRKLNVADAPFPLPDNAFLTAKGLEQAASGKAFDNGTYYIAGWLGEKYVAVNGKVDKLSRLILEQGTTDKKTLVVGETWNIGDGWTLTANSIEARTSPRQVWLILAKDGTIKDQKNVSRGTPDAQPIYTYVEKSLAGETDVPLFVTYVDSIFAGATSDMVQLRYTWLISDSVKDIKSGDTFGEFKDAEVTNGNKTLRLRNSDKSINLTRDSTINLMGNLSFRVADNNTLRFYPEVDVTLTEEIIREETKSPAVKITAPKNGATLTVLDNTVTISVSDASPPINVSLYLNGNLVKNFITTKSSETFTTEVDYLPGIINRLKASAVDRFGNMNFSIVNVNIINNTNTSSVVLYENETMEINLENQQSVDITTGNGTIDGTITVTSDANVTRLNGSINLANRTFGLKADEVALDRYIEIDSTVNKSNISSVNLTMFYTDAELDINRDGDTTDEGIDIDENRLTIYWWNGTGWEPLNKGSDYSTKGGPKVQDVRRNLTVNKLTVQLDHFSTFSLVGEQIPTTTYTPPSGNGGSSSGGGGGGGGTSGENFSNIEIKEKHDLHIFKDKVTSYAFTSKGNPILFINITGNISAGEINTAIEVLSNTSTLVKVQAPGIVYKNTNVWVGTSGFAGPKNIKGAVIRFKVENSWLDYNKLAASDIRMMKWDGKEWIQLETALKEKDSINAYFEAKTDKFSHFAITGIKGLEIPAVTPTITVQANPTSTATSSPEKGTPGFEGIMVIIALSAIYVFRKS